MHSHCTTSSLSLSLARALRSSLHLFFVTTAFLFVLPSFFFLFSARFLHFFALCLVDLSSLGAYTLPVLSSIFFSFDTLHGEVVDACACVHSRLVLCARRPLLLEYPSLALSLFLSLISKLLDCVVCCCFIKAPVRYLGQLFEASNIAVRNRREDAKILEGVASLRFADAFAGCCARR